MSAPAQHRNPLPFGLCVFAAAAICLGLLGLVWSDFALTWQRVGPDASHRLALARLAALIELGCGIALLWTPTRRVGALLLTALYAVFVLLWIPPVVAHPAIYDGWGNIFEELSLVFGGLVAFTVVAPPDSAWSRRRRTFARLYGICPISFAIDQLVYLAGAATWVPRWIPPSQKFWIVATAVFFFMAAAAILSDILAGLAARLLTVMILLFGALIWAPRLAAAPHVHMVWSGNVINLAMAAAAWVVSDVLCEPIASRAMRHPARPTAVLQRIDERRTKTAV
ncbi:MAG: hypothetical protein WBW84_07760 [Acidobacteriaceae bacterium]